MNVWDKTKEELINELLELQQKYNTLEGLYKKDISECRQTEEKLRESEQLYRFLIVNLNEGILLEDSNRNIVATNQLFCDMFAIPAAAEALVGANCSESAEQTKILFKNPNIFVADKTLRT